MTNTLHLSSFYNYGIEDPLSYLSGSGRPHTRGDTHIAPCLGRTSRRLHSRTSGCSKSRGTLQDTLRKGNIGCH